MLTILKFIALYINTAIVVTLCNANLDVGDEDKGIIGNLTSNGYIDYSNNWFANVGYLIVYTMVLNMFMPIAVSGSSAIMHRITKIMDQNGNNSTFTYISKSKNVF